MMPTHWNILLDSSGDVITRDGEIIGTWSTDDSDAFYEYTHNGASEPLFGSPFKGLLCKYIWHFHLDPNSVHIEKDDLWGDSSID